MSAPHDFYSAYVLHSRPYRDTSLIADLLVDNGARLAAVVKGGRTSRKNPTTRCPLFTRLEVNLRGKSELKTATQIDPLEGAVNLQGQRLLAGMYLNELLCKVLSDQSDHPGLYEQYSLAIQQLALVEDVEPPLREFELALLQLLGYGIDLRNCAAGLPINANTDYYFCPGHGLALQPQVQSTGPLLGQHILDFGSAVFNTESRKVGKQICRKAVQHLLGGRQLNSRRLFTSMQT